MPVEIRELVIKATVNQGNASTSASGTTAAASGSSQNGTGEILQECIDQVTQILEDKKER